MTDDELRDAARRIWAKFNAHDLEPDPGLPVSPEFENHNALPGTPRGQEGFRQVPERLFAAFPDMRFEVEEIFVTEQRVATLGWMSGTQEGQFGKLPPSGRSFRARQIHTYGFDEQGRILDHLAVRDDIAMLGQLGHLPSD
jgi:predicted ester cyclase